MDLDRIIRDKLRIKRGDNLPFTGWNKLASRTTLAEIMAEVGFKYGAEIGVRYGGYSLILCQTIPELKILCVDPYMPYRGRRPDQGTMDKIYEHAKRLLSQYNVEFIRKTSMDAVKDIPDGSLDFVYIDAMHEFDPVMMDIICWTPKVRMGGIVSGHDFVESYNGGVVGAVRAYTYAHNINEWYITLDRNEKEPVPSWFWVRR
jgi:hypothetical protein